MNKLSAVLRLTRIEHSAMLVVAVFTAELVAGGLPQYQVLAASLLAPALISMGAFAINDYFDVESDRANRRMNRPLATGALKRGDALAISVLCSAAGIAFSIIINQYVFMLALIFAALAFIYSYKLKDIILVGNVYIAFSMVVPFIFGDLVVSNTIPMSIILISFVIFLSGLAREIHGMARDRVGDIRARHTRNLVSRIGERRSLEIAFVLYMEAIAIGVFLFFYQPSNYSNPFAYNATYLYIITIANLLLFYVAAGAVVRPGAAFLRKTRNISLGAMGIALLAYLLSVVYPMLVLLP